MTLKEILSNIKSDLLTEDMTKEITTLFEATVSEKVEAKIDDLENQFEEYKKEEIEKLEEKTKEYVETYLVDEISNYIKFANVEFMKENKLEVENGVKAEMFDKFMSGIKSLLSENNIEVNEAKGLEKIEADLKSSKDDYNKVAKENIELKEKNQLLESGLIFEKLSADLSVEEKENFGKMLSDFDTDDLKLFEEKAKIVKENIKKGIKTEGNGDGDDEEEGTTNDDNNDDNFEGNVDDDDISEAMKI